MEVIRYLPETFDYAYPELLSKGRRSAFYVPQATAKPIALTAIPRRKVSRS